MSAIKTLKHAAGGALKHRAWGKLAAGAGATVLLPYLLPPLWQAIKPAARTAAKEGIKLYNRGRLAASEVRESLEDLSAEVAAESKAKEAPKPRRKKATT